MSKLTFPTAIIFDNDNFIVNGQPSDKEFLGEDMTFEVVRKNSDDSAAPRLAFLHGDAAQLLYAYCAAWAVLTPLEAEVEAVLDGLTQLNTVALHIQ